MIICQCLSLNEQISDAQVSTFEHDCDGSGLQVAATLSKNVLTPSNQEVKVLNVSEVKADFFRNPLMIIL